MCHVSPVFEGFSINSAVQRIDIGGRDVTNHLLQLLRRSGYAFHTTAEFEIVKKIKEKWCYVAPMGSLGPDELYNLPSKSTGTISGGGSGQPADHQTLYFLPDGT